LALWLSRPRRLLTILVFSPGGLEARLRVLPRSASRVGGRSFLLSLRAVSVFGSSLSANETDFCCVTRCAMRAWFFVRHSMFATVDGCVCNRIMSRDVSCIFNSRVSSTVSLRRIGAPCVGWPSVAVNAAFVTRSASCLLLGPPPAERGVPPGPPAKRGSRDHLPDSSWDHLHWSPNLHDPFSKKNVHLDFGFGDRLRKCLASTRDASIPTYMCA